MIFSEVDIRWILVGFPGISGFEEVSVGIQRGFREVTSFEIHEDSREPSKAFK